MYVIDTTPDLNSPDINDELNWIRNQILPGTSWIPGQMVAMASYGTPDLDFPPVTSSLSDVCNQLDDIQFLFKLIGSYSAFLLDTVASINSAYYQSMTNMVLFTASK